MKEKKKKLALNLVGLSLLGLLAFGIFGLPEIRAEGNWNLEEAESSLASSFEKLRDLKMRSDWDTMYDMVDPKQRELVDKINFLAFYGKNVLTMREFELVGAEINEEERTATTLVKQVAELNVARLPVKFRQGFQAPSQEELTREIEIPVEWVWRNGSWFFLMEQQVLRNLEVAKGF